MTETINYVREDQIQDERTAGMIGCVNQNHRQKNMIEEIEIKRRRARIQEIEAEKAARRQKIINLACWVWAYVVAVVILILMAHTGVIAGWVMHLFTAVFSVGIGKIAGESGLFCGR